MPIWVGKTYLTRADLDREAAAIKTAFDDTPIWRRMLTRAFWQGVLCRAFHRKHHEGGALYHSWACQCSKCGHAWVEHD